MKKLIIRQKYVLPVLALLCLGLVTATAEAALLDYQFFGSGVYGEAGGMALDDPDNPATVSASFEIHIIGDTAFIDDSSGFPQITNLTGNISITGGLLASDFSGTFDDPLYVFADGGYIGFGTNSGPEGDQLYFYIPVAATYDLLTDFGPIYAGSGYNGTTVYNYLDTGTNSGAVLFDYVDIGGFQATSVAAVPIPPSLMLFASGLIGLFGFRKRFMR